MPRLRTLLPEEYQDSYEDLQPAPMRSAGLKYGADGRVAWNEIWGSFCDLAMAGGPPHKGKLLEPGVEADINAQFGRYDAVAEEVCRGIRMATGLRSYISPTPGWVCVTCQSDAMAEWLARAIVMENVAARRSGAILELPAGAALPPREGNQERRHRHCEDVPLLDGPHSCRTAAGDRRAVRNDQAGDAMRRA